MAKTEFDGEMDTCAPYDTPAGTRLRFSFPTNGNDRDGEWARLHLTPNFVYTLDRSEIYDYSTDFFLVERPRIPFNSVMFSVVEQEHPTNG